MPRAADVPLLLLLVPVLLTGTADALYKRWIPDTNYENKTNWDKGDVPCGSDVVQFPAQSSVSVYVETLHSVQEMRLPLTGEFILSPGAGFYAVDGPEPGCGQGLVTQFEGSKPGQWFDPNLWQAAATVDDIEKGHFLFSVHEESVPCWYDDVIFKPRSSFVVDTAASGSSIDVETVAVLGQTFSRTSDFSAYRSSLTGRLQFQGSTTINIRNSGCGDPTGCECGNSGNGERICAAVKCPPLSCERPLRPVGHCCNVCGAIVSVHYTNGFNLESYRQRVRYLFLSHGAYKSVQLGMSKVLKTQRLLGLIPFSTKAEIQVVIVDGDTDEDPQSDALARDIVRDATEHGSNLGIVQTEVQSSSGGDGDSDGQDAGMVVGVVIGVLILVAAVAALVAVLVRRGVVNVIVPPVLPTLKMPSLSFRRRTPMEDLGGPLDHGFDNPIFDRPNLIPDVPHLYGKGDSISMTQTGVHFVNPVYDENEADFNV